jgi:hypothetical protein
MIITQTKITTGINLLRFNTQRDLASTFLRFQEHYESPRFRGKVFTLEEYKEWYTQNSPEGRKTGEFTYYDDWDGFNIPSYVLTPFYQGKFDPLSRKEKTLLELLEEESKKFYVIGVFGEPKRAEVTLKHEIGHGLFYTSPSYKEEVLRLTKQFDLRKLKRELQSTAGYHPDVMEDEIHAYGLSCSNPENRLVPRELRVLLNQVYQRYIKKEQ